MAEQAKLALASGVPKAVYQTNGEMIRLAPDGPETVDHVLTGRLVLDGDVILPANGVTVNERRKIGISGLIAVAVLAVLTVVVTVAINMFDGKPRDVQVPDDAPPVPPRPGQCLFQPAKYGRGVG